MTSTQLGRVQLLIMQVLWHKKRATAREITEAISEREAIAHSTVQTLLRGLEEKSAVGHEAEGRTFVFFPLVEEHQFKESATRDFIERVFGGNVTTLMAHLLNDDDRVTREEVDAIRDLIKNRSKGSGKKSK
jgi:BlaI family penicillinase repressor